MVPSLYAGTYTIEGVDWYPSGNHYGLDGGTIGFSGFDIAYTLDKSISAPTFGGSYNVYANPAVTGMWRWKVRWVGAPGEPAPLTVGVKVHSKGSGSTYAQASSNTAGRTGSGSASVNDPNLTAWESEKSVSGPSGPIPPDQDSAPYTSKVIDGGVTFNHVSGTTYEGYVTFSVQSQAALIAHGEVSTVGPPYMIYSGGWASVYVDVKMRLTHVDGVRLQNDLP